MKTIIELEAERLAWSKETFTEATPQSSLEKLKGEIAEVEYELDFYHEDNTPIIEEFADCLMCLFDAAGRLDILPVDIFAAFEKKYAKNKARVWKKNPDNSYSHVKS